MATVFVDDTYLEDIADAIRSKNSTQNTYKPSQMADAISALPTGGITPTGTKNITANGTDIDVAAYAYADVAVSNTYAAGDEGKVVSNGALVSQTSDTVTTNDTYDTTLISSLTVNVSGGGGSATLIEKSISSNGTYNASSDSADGYSKVVVSVPTGTARSSSDLTANNLTVTAPAGLYASDASKTLSDQNLIAGNVKKDVTIFGVTGSYEGSGGGSGWSTDEIAEASSASTGIRGDLVLSKAITSARYRAFGNMVGITSISSAYDFKIPAYCFCDCTGLLSAMFPYATGFTGNAGSVFSGCTSLKVIDWGSVSSMNSSNSDMIKNCNALETMIFRKSSSPVTISSANCFRNCTPLASGGSGITVYIPKVLYDHLGDGTSNDYKSLSNWSTYNGNGKITWAKIEGSIYELS